MLSKILKLKNVELLTKNDQRNIIGGRDFYEDDGCGGFPNECQTGYIYAICPTDPSQYFNCDPCQICVN